MLILDTLWDTSDFLVNVVITLIDLESLLFLFQYVIVIYSIYIC